MTRFDRAFPAAEPFRRSRSVTAAFCADSVRAAADAQRRHPLPSG